MPTLDSGQFVRERTYLNNVTEKTREWYQTPRKACLRFQATAGPRGEDAPPIARTDLEQFVVHLRERGVKPVSCNCCLRAMNAFCGWVALPTFMLIALSSLIGVVRFVSTRPSM